MEPLLNQKVDGRFSHSRLRQVETDAVGRLPKEVTGAVVKGTTTVKCEAYAVSKAHKVILERIPRMDDQPDQIQPINKPTNQTKSLEC